LRGNDISYGIYIYHGLILTVIMQEHWVRRINLFEVIVLSYTLGCLSWLFVERPFIRMKKKTIKLDSPAPAAKKHRSYFRDFLKPRKALFPVPPQPAEE
jgi:peptidoglycan/LPS O-acetylase OafA/YrhL